MASRVPTWLGLLFGLFLAGCIGLGVPESPHEGPSQQAPEAAPGAMAPPGTTPVSPADPPPTPAADEPNAWRAANGADGPTCADETRPPARGYGLGLTGADGRARVVSGFASSELDALAFEMGPRLDAWAYDATSGCWHEEGWAPFLTWGLASDPVQGLWLGYDIFLDEGPPAAWPRNLAQPISEIWMRSADDGWTRTLQPELVARSAPSIVFEPQMGLFVLFGGCYAAYACFDEVWTFDPEQDAWQKRPPSPGPMARNFAGMTYVPELEGILLFGGHHTGADGFQRKLNDTWLYDAATHSWTQITTAAAPLPRAYPTLAYVAGEGRTYLFGGSAAAGQRADLWAFDAATRTWQEMAFTTGPSPRAWHAFAYDATGHALVVFGGGDSQDCPYWDETWVYDLASTQWYAPDRRAPGEDPHPQTGLLCDP